LLLLLLAFANLLAFTASDLNVFTLALFAASFRSVAGALFSCCCRALLVLLCIDRDASMQPKSGLVLLSCLFLFSGAVWLLFLVFSCWFVLLVCFVCCCFAVSYSGLGVPRT